MKKLILASGSPRRRELMAQMGLEFEVITAKTDEETHGLAPAETVRELSLRKAGAVAALHPDAVVVGADTIVAVDGVILGKPRDKDDALAMLMALSGRAHSVFTGVTVISAGSVEREVLETKVHFAEISRTEAENYIATGEPMDKAGAYGIQGRGGIFVERIEGDYYNVVGLPIHTLYRMLRKVGAV